MPRARRGASAAERCRQTNALSVVRKSRNSSGGLYRRRWRSAHDRRRANAMRFLMKTLRARLPSRLIRAFRQNSRGALGCAPFSVSPSKSGSGRLADWLEHKLRSWTLSQELNPPSQGCCYSNTRIINPFSSQSGPGRSRYFSHMLRHVRGRLRPTVE
jgi:hypothetical protein